MTPDIARLGWLVERLKQQCWMRSNGVCFPSDPKLMYPKEWSRYDSLLIGLDLQPSWLRSPLSSWSVWWFILTDISMPSFALLRYSCILLFYDHTIMILTILMTHIFSYLSLTLSSLSLDSHSFDYSFLSCLCSFLFSPPHFLCNNSILPMMFYLRSYSLSWPL